MTEGEKVTENGDHTGGKTDAATAVISDGQKPVSDNDMMSGDSSQMVKGNSEKDGDHCREIEQFQQEKAVEPPDGGWGWVVMISSMWCNGSVFGIQNAFGIMFVALLTVFGPDTNEALRFKTAWVGSLSMGMIFFCSPIVSIFTDLFGCRKTAVVGAAVAFIGIMCSSFVRSLGPLYFTYGIIFACGCSFAYQPSLVILGHYFKKRLGLVNGIVTAGSSFFTILLPLFLEKLIENVGLFNTLRFLSIFMFILFLAGFTYKPWPPTEKKNKSDKKNSFKCPSASKVFNVHVWKILVYRIWAFGIPTALFGYFVPYVHLMSHVEETFGKDVNKEILLMCLGITSGIGRLIFGRVADCVPGTKKVYLQVISFFVIGFLSMMIPLCNAFGGLIAVCLLMGLFDGCFICLMAPIAYELVGAENVSQAIGFLLGLMSIPMTVGPPVAGFLRDRLGSYDVAFYLAGVPPIIGGVVLCFIPWIQGRKLKEKEAEKAESGAAEKMLDNTHNALGKAEEQHRNSESVI
ncbi:monocarboxylate transporter 10 [Protopterus annectens]|uniref:monocarboxylate transporter 10 n=1 Tax=Protopterus annectens TaxID=7888 RepID=UPI001CFA2D00|nr:monocarboxylate transporter 10 [Protopterus annectens]